MENFCPTLTYSDVLRLVGRYLPYQFEFKVDGLNRDYFYSTYYHYIAARNDAHWHHLCERADACFQYWATEWYKLCPLYFEYNYPGQYHWADGYLDASEILEGDADDFPDRDSDSTLMHEPANHRQSIDCPIHPVDWRDQAYELPADPYSLTFSSSPEFRWSNHQFRDPRSW